MAERNITRKVLKEKTYNVYKMEGTSLVLLETISAKGKVSEKELAEKHKVKQVVLVPTKEQYETYAMTVEEFMKYAKLVEDKEEKEVSEEKNVNSVETV